MLTNSVPSTMAVQKKMSLALPTNIATRNNLAEILCEMMGAMPGPVTIHVCDGRLAGHRIQAHEFQETADLIVGCRFVYVLETMSGRMEPIAAFVANQALGRGQLRYLIDDRPIAADGELPRCTTETLAVYIRSLFDGNKWLNAVTIPAHVNSIDGLFGLHVTDGELSTVTLKDAKHRPHSSRKMK